MGKVCFLCTDPWENFLPWAVQGHSREYFEFFYHHYLKQDEKLSYQELIENYGETNQLRDGGLFEDDSGLCLVYARGKSEWFLKEIFKNADMVLMGVPFAKKEFDKMYVTICPWLNKIVFLLEECEWGTSKFAEQLCKEYKIDRMQIVQIRKNWRLQASGDNRCGNKESSS